MQAFMDNSWNLNYLTLYNTFLTTKSYLNKWYLVIRKRKQIDAWPEPKLSQ